MDATPPTFVHGDHPRLVCSLLRSGNVEVHEADWHTSPVMLPLWWGGEVWVEKGSVVRYFLAPGGMVFESVVPGETDADG